MSDHASSKTFGGGEELFPLSVYGVGSPNKENDSRVM